MHHDADMARLVGLVIFLAGFLALWWSVELALYVVRRVRTVRGRHRA